MELRAYFFQNFYLQGIHAGIQSQHTTAEMAMKYYLEDKDRAISTEEDRIQAAAETFRDWAKNHKTTIVLNGGMSKDLRNLVRLLESPDNPYPWDFFCESQDALEGCITNVGIILPDFIFNYKLMLTAVNQGTMLYDDLPELSPWESELQTLLSRCRLMA